MPTFTSKKEVVGLPVPEASIQQTSSGLYVGDVFCSRSQASASIVCVMLHTADCFIDLLIGDDGLVERNV